MSTADQTRTIAFDELYQLPEAREHAGSDPVAALEALPREQRVLAMNVAARRLAFQILFEMDARNLSDPSFVTTTLTFVEGLGASASEEIAALIQGAHTQRSKADARFRELAPEWPTYRLAGTDRAILRLAFHELSLGRTPAAIVINEAVELAKHYSTERSPPFINALLDKAAKSIEAERGAAPTSVAKPSGGAVTS